MMQQPPFWFNLLKRARGVLKICCCEWLLRGRTRFPFAGEISHFSLRRRLWKGQNYYFCEAQGANSQAGEKWNFGRSAQRTGDRKTSPFLYSRNKMFQFAAAPLVKYGRCWRRRAHTHSDLWRLSAHKCSLCILTLSPVLSRSAVAFAVANKRGSADTTPSDAPTQPPSHPATLQIIKQPLEWRDGLFSAAELLDARRPPDRCKLLPRRLAPTSASVSQLITPTSPNHGICLRFNFVYGNVATAREF